MEDRTKAATAMARRAPSYVYARAYRALLGARHVLQDPQRYLQSIPEEERWRRHLSDVSRAAYEVAMKVSTALSALPEFSPERVDELCAACWKLVGAAMIFSSLGRSNLPPPASCFGGRFAVTRGSRGCLELRGREERWRRVARRAGRYEVPGHDVPGRASGRS